ncbi:MAG: protein kinase [Gemmatimonadota bacterium]|nr:MAG: protein kinase [Gemmatimonadota bacterium]
MKNPKTQQGRHITDFDLPPGYELAGKYQIISKLGSGWEGEVYKIREMRTGIDRAAKLFFPQRNIGNRTAKRYAKKLHKLRHCSILIQYHTEELIRYRKVPVTVLVSEYVEGELLSDFLKRHPGHRLQPFEALHLLHSLTKGMEEIHLHNEYHGDLHLDNIIVRRFGLAFDLKLIDLFHWEGSKSENRQTDICFLIRVFYDTLGGARHYQRHPEAVKYICSGLKQSIILKKFRTMTQLRKHLETMEW